MQLLRFFRAFWHAGLVFSPQRNKVCELHSQKP
jgi:hypothetical protein